MSILINDLFAGPGGLGDGFSSLRSGAIFCADGPSYADLARFAADQGDLFDRAEEPIPCFRGD